MVGFQRECEENLQGRANSVCERVLMVGYERRKSQDNARSLACRKWCCQDGEASKWSSFRRLAGSKLWMSQ